MCENTRALDNLLYQMRQAASAARVDTLRMQAMRPNPPATMAQSKPAAAPSITRPSARWRMPAVMGGAKTPEAIARAVGSMPGARADGRGLRAVSDLVG